MVLLFEVFQAIVTLGVVVLGLLDSTSQPAIFYNYTTGVAIAPDVLKNYVVPDKLCFIAHGWLQTYNAAFFPELAVAMESLGYTTIGVDWSKLASDVIYVTSAYNTQLVGEYISSIACAMGVSPDKIAIIGHSMGAHVAGQAGRHYQTTCGKGPLARITACDAAGPGFIWNSAALMPTDAKTVVAIHTDLFFGTENPVGTHDFFAGTVLGLQPGCPASVFEDTPANQSISDLGTLISLYARRMVFCSHERSVIYFMEVAQKLGPDAFVGTDRSNSTNKCQITVEKPQCSCGSYDFDTNWSAPYAKDVPINT